MNLRSCRAVRLVAPTAALVVLAGCGSSAANPTPAPVTSTPVAAPSTSAPSPTPPAPTMAAPSVPAAPTPSAGPVVSSTPPAADGHCTLADLKVALGQGEGAAGSTYTTLLLTNTGGTSCTLNGHPGVSYVAGADQHQVGGTAVRSDQQPVRVSLAPGETASAVVRQPKALNYPEATCAPTQVTGVRVYPPDDTSSVVLPLATTACADQQTGRPTVSIVEAGTRPTL